jgi:hypothetical protein
MGPQDTKVWQAAVRDNLFPADRYEYDVRLGGATPTGIPLEDTHVMMWATLTKKRIDVVAWRGRVPWILEVKPVASFAALGQCLGYGFMWEKEKPGRVKPRLAVVCAICDRDLLPCFQSFGISVVELRPEVAEVLLTPKQRSPVDIAT